MAGLNLYQSSSGTLKPVWTLEIQTLPEDTDRILDAVMAVYPLGYGRYERNASITAPGRETAQPKPNSTTPTTIQLITNNQLINLPESMD